MSAFNYDRNLPVSLKQNVNDVQDMFEQLRDFLNGGIAGDNLVASTISATELGDEAVSFESIHPTLAAATGITKLGARRRRITNYRTNVAVPGTGSLQSVGSITFTAETETDHMLFGAMIKDPSITGNYTFEIRLDGVRCVNTFVTTLNPGDPPVILGEKSFLVGPSCFQWHLVPIGRVPFVPRTVELFVQAPIGVNCTWGTVYLAGMMIDVAGVNSA